MLNQHKILRVLQLISLLKKEPSKSIKFIAGILESTDRTVYRYLDLVKELGFDLQRDSHNRFYIVSNENNETLEFSNEEASLLRELLLSSGSKSNLKDALLRKIYLKSEIVIQGNHLLNAHLGKVVSELSKAITEHKQVVLKKYQSANSNTITDRLVEPISFTDNYTSLCAFEVETAKNKYFNIERITEVEVLQKQNEFEGHHQLDVPDAFGFTALNGLPFDIDIRLNLRAFVLLKQEYPMVVKFVKQEAKTGYYRLKTSINNPKPIVRFVLGLLDDVEIIGSVEFKDYLKKYVVATLENNKSDFEDLVV
ncbi:helix-turn-helix transcriptional regulator [Flavobacterium sp.]|jgi:predicted DNA-binding transcriptional regulator YafY|uniref:helix-turn-helix transcriptional regulator n=1 Tax=Flavobacterium sp. TaxID=239 RepID=UPI0037C066EA